MTFPESFTYIIFIRASTFTFQSEEQQTACSVVLQNSDNNNKKFTEVDSDNFRHTFVYRTTLSCNVKKILNFEQGQQ